MRDAILVTLASILVVFVLWASGIGLKAANYAVEPFFRQQETRINRSSYEYTSTKRELIANLETEIQNLQAESLKTNDENVRAAYRQQIAALNTRIAVEKGMLNVP